MKRVLFVDDEPQLLAGLRRILHPLRAEWDMTFVGDPREALARLQATRFDVLVSDLHMAGLTGLQLFEQARSCSPDTVRVILSGTSDRAEVLRVVGVAHQFVAKPCTSAELKIVIGRALALRALLGNERLLGIASRIDSLPSLPSLYLEMTQLLERGHASLEDVGAIVARDLALSAKVLHLANSAFFGSARAFTSPVEATVYLGLDTISALVLTAHAFGHASALEPHTLEELWAHSLAVGALARALARIEGLDAKSEEHAFLAGLMHEVGLLVLAAELPDELAAAWKHARRFAVPLAEAERRVLGASRAAVGAYLMGLWGLPDPVVEAIAFHPTPAALPHEQFLPLTAVHVATALAVGRDSPLPASERDVDLGYLEKLGLAHRLPAWREACTAQRRAA